MTVLEGFALIGMPLLLLGMIFGMIRLFDAQDRRAAKQAEGPTPRA